MKKANLSSVFRSVVATGLLGAVAAFGAIGCSSAPGVKTARASLIESELQEAKEMCNTQYTNAEAYLDKACNLNIRQKDALKKQYQSEKKVCEDKAELRAEREFDRRGISRKP